jgi:MSHA biogenesis protein MshG
VNFRYTGRAAAGAVSGEIDAGSAAAAADLLVARGITPLLIKGAARKAEPAASSSSTTPRLADLIAAWRMPPVRPVDLLLFSRQLHTLMKAGVPILRALAGLQESAANARMKLTLGAVRQSLGSGLDLSMSLAQQGKVFSPFYVALVRVGEMTGRLEEVFLRLFHHIEFELYMAQQIKSALRYPMFVVAAMVAAIGVINVMVVPAFASVFSSFGAELPLATRLLMASSSFTLNYGGLIVAAAVGGIWLFRRWVATTAGRLVWDRTKLKLPLAGKIIHKGMLARFARSLAMSLKSGVPIEQALSTVAQTVENAHIARKVEGMREHVERGESILSAAAAANVFTPIVLQMIQVGEETGAVDELMDEVADLYTNEVQYELKTLGQQIEPILIVMLGVLVLVLALGVFLPVWDLGRVALKP